MIADCTRVPVVLPIWHVGGFCLNFLFIYKLFFAHTVIQKCYCFYYSFECVVMWSYKFIIRNMKFETLKQVWFEIGAISQKSHISHMTQRI